MYIYYNLQRYLDPTYVISHLCTHELGLQAHYLSTQGMRSLQQPLPGDAASLGPGSLGSHGMNSRNIGCK